MKEQVFQEITKFDPAGMKKLNDNLRWLFTKVRGGISMRDVDGTIRLEFAKPATGLDTGGFILINKDGIYASGGEIDLRTSDGLQFLSITPDGMQASSIQSPTVAPRYDGAAELYVDAEATDEQLKAGNYYRSLADACAALSGRHVDKDVRIWFASGMTEYADIALTGICGSGSVYLDGGQSVVQGRLLLSQCAVPVRIRRLKVSCAWEDALEVRGMFAQIDTCTLTVAENGFPITARNGAKLWCAGCTLTGLINAGYVDETSQGVFMNCTGNGRLLCDGVMRASGTVPVGGCTRLGGFMDAEGVTETGTSGTVPAPEATQTAEYAMTHSDSYAGGTWTFFDDEDIRQGMVGESERIRGCIWFDAAQIQSELGTKTIQQASLRLRMQSGYGRGVAVSVQVCGTDMAYDARTGMPRIVREYGTIGSANPGEVNVIALPNQAVQDLAAGTICALVLRSDDEEMYKGRSYSRNYARFDGQTSGTADTVPMLTVKYS